MRNMSLLDGDTVTTAARGREFWHGVLLAGGFTAVPRWTLDPVPGVAEHEAKICNEVVAALRRLADELAVPLSSVLLTAHANSFHFRSDGLCLPQGTSYAAGGGIAPGVWVLFLVAGRQIRNEIVFLRR